MNNFAIFVLAYLFAGGSATLAAMYFFERRGK
jgi:hypothetical protein